MVNLFKKMIGARRPVKGFGLRALLLILFGYAGCNFDPPSDDSAPETPKQPPTAFEGTIVAVGDSLTAGFGVAEEEAYPARLAQKLQASGHHFRVINAGVSGETSSGARARIEWILSRLDPDIVILETGANDGLRGIDPSVLEANLNYICNLLIERRVQVLLTGMKMFPNLGPEYTKAFLEIYPRVAENHQVVFMPFFLEDVAGVTDLNQPDRTHPTAQGYTRITDNLYPYVLEAIKRWRGANGGRQQSALRSITSP